VVTLTGGALAPIGLARAATMPGVDESASVTATVIILRMSIPLSSWWLEGNDSA
jgi:hypothetical protein